MPRAHRMRDLSRKRRVLLSHGRNSFPRIQHRSAIASWSLRRLGQGNWGETTWLKLWMLTRIICAKRGWRAVLLSDCYLEGSGTFSFRDLGGSLLAVFNSRCGFLLDPGMAIMWRRGDERRMIPLMAVLWLLVPCAGRGFCGKVLSLVSVYVLSLGRVVTTNDGSCLILSLRFWAFFRSVRFGLLEGVSTLRLVFGG